MANGVIKLPEITTPSTPESGYARVYVGTDKNLKKIDDAGQVSTFETLASNVKRKSFGITIDGGGSVITTGVKGYVTVPYTGTITQWTLLADQSGSIVIDVWKDTYANYPPTVADTIAGSEKPTLTAAIKNQDTTLSTWTTAVVAGDVIGFKVDSATTVTRVTLVIEMAATNA